MTLYGFEDRSGAAPRREVHYTDKLEVALQLAKDHDLKIIVIEASVVSEKEFEGLPALEQGDGLPTGTATESP